MERCISRYYKLNLAPYAQETVLIYIQKLFKKVMGELFDFARKDL